MELPPGWGSPYDRHERCLAAVARNKGLYPKYYTRLQDGLGRLLDDGSSLGDLPCLALCFGVPILVRLIGRFVRYHPWRRTSLNPLFILWAASYQEKAYLELAAGYFQGRLHGRGLREEGLDATAVGLGERVRFAGNSGKVFEKRWCCS